ncbi:MAG: hypothetical protein MI725_03695 [Pirellulales bacterium]|nr:hypothetical protein [Pirellulales bacterium]
MSGFQPSEYGPIFAPLLEIDRCRALDEGAPEPAAREMLAAVTVTDAFAHTRVVDQDMARCCLAGVWLVHDFLDESHTISQGISTAEGSFWHGIMHRREGDFSNAKYWFRKVGQHPVFSKLGDGDPFQFVDACQAALQNGGSDEQHCRQLQQIEWEQLFDHCYKHACRVG